MKSHLSLSSRFWIPLAAVGLMASAAFAGDDLVGNSPFVPDGWEPPRQPTPPPTRTPQQQDRPLDRVEFRGMTTFNGERSFSIHDPSSNRSFWLREGQGEAGFKIVEYRRDEDAVIVEHDGNNRTIPLHEAKIAAAEQPRQAPRPAGGGRTGGGQPARQVEQDPEERMQNLAEEIRHRREMRRQILERSESGETSGGNQGADAPVIPSSP